MMEYGVHDAMNLFDEIDEYDNMALEEQEYEDIMMRSFVDNDPVEDVTTLSVGFGGDVRPPNTPNDWGSLGRAIGANTQLRELSLGQLVDINSKTHYSLRNGLPTDEHELASFFSGLAMNRSIQTLKFEEIELNDDLIELMAPFLADNHVFKCLEVVVNDLNKEDYITTFLASFLLMFDYLTEFRLSYEGYNDDLDGVDEGRGMRTIVDYFDIVIQALTVHTELMQLTFNNIDIRRRGCDSLVKLLNNCTNLKELHFSNMGIINDGWQDIFTALQNTKCKLEKIELRGVEGANEVTALCFSHALLHHSTTLKSLHLNQQVRVVIPSVIIPLLQDPKSILEELSLVNDNAANDAYSVTNEGIEVLTYALAVNRRLKSLVLTGHRSITAEGWMIFSAVLRNPSSKLEKLVLYRNHINDNVVNSFAEALTSNRKLQDLRGGYAALTRNLCDKSSILRTYHSNHILKMLPYASLPNDFASLLKINRENCANQAARLKIILTHFSGSEINMLPFAEMSLSVKPHAIAWMAKDMHSYQLLRAMPSLLEGGTLSY